METRVRESPTGVLGWIAGSYYLYSESIGTQARLYHLDLIEGEIVLASTDPEYDLRIKQDSLNHWIENTRLELSLLDDTELMCKNITIRVLSFSWKPVIFFGDIVAQYETELCKKIVSFKIKDKECLVTCLDLNMIFVSVGKVYSLDQAATLTTKLIHSRILHS